MSLRWRKKGKGKQVEQEEQSAVDYDFRDLDDLLDNPNSLFLG